MDKTDDRDPLGITGAVTVLALIAGSWLLLKMLWTILYRYWPM